IIDLVKSIVAVIKVFSTIESNGLVYEAIAEAVCYVAILVMDSALLMLVVEGTTKVGKKLKEKIYELNAKIPENTRNVLRQYAFSGAGIDEPKIEYNKWLAGRGDSDSSWKDYLNLETGFGVFMRTLSQTNDADSNYGPNNLLSYSWQDWRRGQEVSNLVEVYSTPVQQLSFDDIDFEDIADDADFRNELINELYAQGASWWLGGWLTLTITLSPLLLISLETISNTLAVLKTMMEVLGIISAILTVVFLIMCCIWGYQDPFCSWAVFAASATAFFATYLLTVGQIPTPDSKAIPCLEYGSSSNDLTLGLEIKRSTTKADGTAMDYGPWIMQYPEITVQSKAEIIGESGGRLFPPLQDYSPQLSFIK
ncbi:MAG: hypothetical protein KJ710_02695, partial [Candidatus Omnitrophica bacterium]|nr:hypothetical protein [Candidatus Omnitrophota bacterium]